jgi:hypothetical protein
MLDFFMSKSEMNVARYGEKFHVPSIEMLFLVSLGCNVIFALLKVYRKQQFSRQF